MRPTVGTAHDGSEPIIRRVTAADLDSVADLQAEAIRVHGVPVYGREAAEAWARLGVQFRHQLLGAGAFFVADTLEPGPAGVVGVGGWSPDGLEPDLAWLRYLFVAPSLGRRGLGRRLVETAEQSAKAAARARMQVWSSLNATTFYQANGYQLLRPGRFPVQAGIDLEYRLLTKSLA
jgi:GNAT superfamily N-acetyltransferase